jgi:hypothetical protein
MNRVIFSWTGFMVLLVLPVFAADPPKGSGSGSGSGSASGSGSGSGSTAKPLDPSTAQFLQPADAGGKIKTVDPTYKTFTLTIELQHLEVDQKALTASKQKVDEILRQEQQLMQEKNPKTRAQLFKDLQQKLNSLGTGTSPYKIITDKKDFDLQAADDVKVRTLNPPLAFDDKGNVVQYTIDDLKKLKGDERLPGYPADFSAVKQGALVFIILSHNKGSGTTPPTKGSGSGSGSGSTSGSGSGSSSGSAPAQPPLPPVTTIFVVDDGSGSSGSGKKP